MEITFTPEIEEKLNEMAVQSGVTADELVQDAVAGMIEEMAGTREMLDRRYDEIKSGKVKLIPGDEVFARMRERSAALRQKSGT